MAPPFGPPRRVSKPWPTYYHRIKHLGRGGQADAYLVLRKQENPKELSEADFERLGPYDFEVMKVFSAENQYSQRDEIDFLVSEPVSSAPNVAHATLHSADTAWYAQEFAGYPVHKLINGAMEKDSVEGLKRLQRIGWEVLRQAVDTFCHLQRRHPDYRISHGDLVAMNVCFRDDKNGDELRFMVKIIDFGHAQKHSKVPKTHAIDFHRRDMYALAELVHNLCHARLYKRRGHEEIKYWKTPVRNPDGRFCRCYDVAKVPEMVRDVQARAEDVDLTRLLERIACPWDPAQLTASEVRHLLRTRYKDKFDGPCPPPKQLVDLVRSDIPSAKWIQKLIRDEVDPESTESEGEASQDNQDGPAGDGTQTNPLTLVPGKSGKIKLQFYRVPEGTNKTQEQSPKTTKTAQGKGKAKKKPSATEQQSPIRVERPRTYHRHVFSQRLKQYTPAQITGRLSQDAGTYSKNEWRDMAVDGDDESALMMWNRYANINR